MNLFLTGEKGVGKSTLLQKLLTELKIEPVGFFTLPYYQDGQRKGFYLHSLTPLANNDQPISIQLDSSSCQPIVGTFDELGCAILRNAMLEQKRVLVIDELGTLESSAFAFLQQVYVCLDQNQLVLGVLKQADSHFLATIRAHPQSKIYTLTTTNRVQVYHELLTILKDFNEVNLCSKNI